MNTLRLYVRSMGILIKSQLQYPVSFLLQTLAQLIMEGGEMLAVVLLVDRFDHLNQWGPGDLYFFFGLMSVTFYLTECFGRGITGNFPSMVRTGQLDTLLVRPRGILTQVICSAVDPRRITCIAVGTVSLAIGSRIREKYAEEFRKLRDPYVRAVLEGLPAHMRKIKEFETQFIFFSDGRFVFHCVKNLVSSGKLKVPEEAQKKALSTLMMPA